MGRLGNFFFYTVGAWRPKLEWPYSLVCKEAFSFIVGGEVFLSLLLDGTKEAHRDQLWDTFQDA